MSDEPHGPPAAAVPARPSTWPGIFAGGVAVGASMVFTFAGKTPDYFGQALVIIGISLISGTSVNFFRHGLRAFRLADEVRKAMKEGRDE